jgi:glycosyltransferase involved in cell wall biosynthesis
MLIVLNMNRYFDISLIIPTYNRSSLLKYTMESLLQQNYNLDRIQVIVSDDGSSDDTADMLKEYMNRLHITYLFQPDEGFRVASARNAGIRAAESDICLFIDAGILLDENCVARHISFHQERPHPATAIGYVYGFQIEEEYTREHILATAIDINDPSESINRMSADGRFHDVREPHYIKYGDDLKQLDNPWIFFWTCHVSVPTLMLFDVGLFDVNYDGNWGIEDNDLGFRLKQAGVDFIVLRHAKSLHYPHKKEKNRFDQGAINCRYFDRKFSTLDTKIFLRNYLHEGK